MTKKFDKQLADASEARAVYFQITPQGVEKAKKTLSGLFAIVSYRGSALRIMAHDPEQTWTALELSYEDQGTSITDDDYLAALRDLERDGFVRRVSA